MENSTPILPDGDTPAESLRRGHELRDARLRPIVIFAVTLVAATLVIQFVVWKYMLAENRGNAREDSAPSPFVADRSPPPEPRLQPSVNHPSQPHEDMEQLKARWEKQLESYGKVDGQPDRVHIPIERAMATSQPTTGRPRYRHDATHHTGRCAMTPSQRSGRGAAPLFHHRRKKTWGCAPTATPVLCAILFLAGTARVIAEPRTDLLKHIRIDQNIGAQIPADLVFHDETGREVHLGDYFGKRPTDPDSLVYLRLPHALHDRAQ